MVNDNHLKKRRSLLLSSRIRFSPTGVNIRDQVIQRILEQNLATENSGEGLSENQLFSMAGIGQDIPILRSTDVRDGINRLIEIGRVYKRLKSGKYIYCLTEEVRNEVEHLIVSAENLCNNVIQDLFNSALNGYECYKEPFFRFLHQVFSKLSDIYIQVIEGKFEKEKFAQNKILNDTLAEILSKEPQLEKEAFRYAVNRFFKESRPDFDKIKWNFAQNFYVIKALGVDNPAYLLTAEILQKASLYLDTNVLIAAITPEHRHYESFQEIVKICNALAISLYITHITNQELNSTIESYAEILCDVIDQIPLETRSKVRNFLLEAYQIAIEDDQNLSLIDFLDRYQDPLQSLKDTFKIELIDDQWFDQEAESTETTELMNKLKLKYHEIRNKEKNVYSAKHDSLLLRWISKENLKHNNSIWLVTLDTSLVSENFVERQQVITLDALLQWITPQCSGIVEEDKLALIFSETISFQLLTTDFFFDLRDFLAFKDMEIETNQLPPEDIEACIREIKTESPNLDPRKSEDREKINRIIQRYFADPGTKYKNEMNRLSQRNIELEKKLEQERQSKEIAEKRIYELEVNIERSKEEKRELEGVRKKTDERMRQIEETLERERKKRLRNKTSLKISIYIFMLLIAEAIVFCVSLKWGEGNNLFEILKDTFWFWSIASGFVFGLFRLSYKYFMGPDCMRVLKKRAGEAEDKKE